MTEFSNEMFQSVDNSSNMIQDMDFYNSSSVPFTSMDLTKGNIIYLCMYYNYSYAYSCFS